MTRKVLPWWRGTLSSCLPSSSIPPLEAVTDGDLPGVPPSRNTPSTTMFSVFITCVAASISMTDNWSLQVGEITPQPPKPVIQSQETKETTARMRQDAQQEMQNAEIHGQAFFFYSCPHTHTSKVLVKKLSEFEVEANKKIQDSRSLKKRHYGMAHFGILAPTLHSRMFHIA